MALRKQGAGVFTADVCRKHGISSATSYAGKAKFGGMDVSEARRLKALENENVKLETAARMRIPTKPASNSDMKPATDSDLKPARVPI